MCVCVCVGVGGYGLLLVDIEIRTLFEACFFLFLRFASCRVGCFFLVFFFFLFSLLSLFRF